MKNKCNLSITFLSFSLILMASIVVLFSFYKYKENNMDAGSSVLASIFSKGEYKSAGIKLKSCGLVHIGYVKGGGVKAMQFQHRCTSRKGRKHRAYRCVLATVYGKPDPKKAYVKNGQVYLSRKDVKNYTSFSRPVKEWICDPEVEIISRRDEKNLVNPKGAFEKRDCCLQTYTKEDFAVQHRCAPAGEKLSCEFMPIYLNPKVPGNYSTKKVGGYKTISLEWVVSDAVPGPMKPKPPRPPTGPIKIKVEGKDDDTIQVEQIKGLREKDRQCGLVVVDSSSKYGKKLQHKCASKGKGYHCAWDRVFADPKPTATYLEKGGPVFYTKKFSKFTSEQEGWVCEPKQKKVRFYGKVQQLRSNQKCGLVPYGKEGIEKVWKPYGRQYQCAPEDHVYSLCKLAKVYSYSGTPGNYAVKKDGAYKNPVHEWVCNSSKLIGSPKKRQCGLVKVGTVPAGNQFQHRCAEPGKGYVCELKEIFAHPKPPTTYVDGGPLYFDDDSEKYSVRREEWVCEPEKVDLAYKTMAAYGKKLKGDRLCGLVPYDADQDFWKGYALQHRCAPEGHLYTSCTLQQVYSYPKTLGNYSSKKALKYKTPVSEWVCDPKKTRKAPDYRSSTSSVGTWD